MKMDGLGADADIRKLCCTCLSVNRKLYQLCAIVDGINNLYTLLSHDLEPYKVGLIKDSTKLYICWECRAIMSRLCKFRVQVCIAQECLSNIENDRCDDKNAKALSRLSITNKNTYDIEYDCTKELQNTIFIDRGVIIDNIKTESDEDVSLFNLNKHSETIDIQNHSGDEFDYENHFDSELIKIEHAMDLVDEPITSEKKSIIKTKDINDVKKKRKRTKIIGKRKTYTFSEENDSDGGERSGNLITNKVVSVVIKGNPNSQGRIVERDTTKTVKKRKWDRRNACFYCQAIVTNYSRHLLRNHADEIEVLQYKAIDDDDPKIRKLRRQEITNKLRNKGNFLHNSKVYFNRDTQAAIIPQRRNKQGASNPSTYAMCKTCLGTYKKSTFFRHLKSCSASENVVVEA